jgi:tRNA dimethylallyltransferase
MKVVVITGPTASGKSELAIDLAIHFGAEIVNADSMQVYRYMDIGTAKVPIEQRKGIPHHLLDIVDPDQEFNAGMYRHLALSTIKDIHSRGKRCFIVGGTGLYIKVLLRGLIPSPPVNRNIRKLLKEEVERSGTETLYMRLKELDPETASRIHPNDWVRITRALEIIELTKQKVSSLFKEHGFRNKELESLIICLKVSRSELYHKIGTRTIKMIDMGLLDETKSLLDRGYGPELKAMNSIGYRHMVKVIKGEWDMDKATSFLIRDTRRYAKRQLTWFRADPEIIWRSPKDMEEITSEIERFYGDEKKKRS